MMMTHTYIHTGSNWAKEVLRWRQLLLAALFLLLGSGLLRRSVRFGGLRQLVFSRG